MYAITQIERSPVSINQVVIELSTLLHHLVGADCALTLSLAASPPWIAVDPVLFEHVLMNLVVNARDAMPAGGIITIATSTVPSLAIGRAGQVVLTVADTGIGMTEPVKDRIFEPFFSTKPADVYSGLGLTTVVNVVEQAGGHVSVDTEPGGGSTFRITLPGQQLNGHNAFA